MLVKYSYVIDHKVIGEYQCDLDELKQVIKHSPNISMMFVRFQNGNEYVYRNGKWYLISATEQII